MNYQIYCSKILLLMIIFFNFTNSQTTYQRITYKSYDTGKMAHKFEIVWSSSNNISPLTDSDSNWIYSILRDSTNASSVIKKENKYFYDKFSSYMLRFDGTHVSKTYVAFDITPTCDTSNAKTTVTVLVRFFNCSYTANVFYTSGDATGDKILVNSDKTFGSTSTDGAITYNSVSGINKSAFLGASSTAAMIGACTVVVSTR